VRSKDIGTAAETKVVRYLAANGFPYAERRALHGGQDLGDVTGIPDVVVEIKGGDAARNASDNQIEAWWGETETERINARAEVGLLVVARSRKNVRDWWAVLSAEHLTHLASSRLGATYPTSAAVMVRLTLADAALLLRAAGWGERLDDRKEVTS
jgi:hypothetical protein